MALTSMALWNYYVYYLIFTLSVYNGIVHDLIWNILYRSVGLKGLINGSVREFYQREILKLYKDIYW